MSKVYAKHESLKNLVLLKNWGLVSTNETDKVRKDHLLSMRNGPNALVFDISPNRNFSSNIKFFDKYDVKPYGSDWNSKFYGLTINGFDFVRKNFSDIKDVTDMMLTDLFNEVFSENLDEDEWIRLRKLN